MPPLLTRDVGSMSDESDERRRFEQADLGELAQSFWDAEGPQGRAVRFATLGLAIAVQAPKHPIPLDNALRFLGVPDLVGGDRGSGRLAYFHHSEDSATPEFDHVAYFCVEHGQVVRTGSNSRNSKHIKITDPQTGDEVSVGPEGIMKPFAGSDFDTAEN